MTNPRHLTTAEQIKLEILYNFIDWNREAGAILDFQVPIYKQRAKIYILERASGKDEITAAGFKYVDNPQKSTSKKKATSSSSGTSSPRTVGLGRMESWDDYDYAYTPRFRPSNREEVISSDANSTGEGQLRPYTSAYGRFYTNGSGQRIPEPSGQSVDDTLQTEAEVQEAVAADLLRQMEEEILGESAPTGTINEVVSPTDQTPSAFDYYSELIDDEENLEPFYSEFDDDDEI